MPSPAFVIDSHDISLHSDTSLAGFDVEGYDAPELEFIGADGADYEPLIDGPAWGAVSLRPTLSNRMKDLIDLLRNDAVSITP